MQIKNPRCLLVAGELKVALFFNSYLGTNVRDTAPPP